MKTESPIKNKPRTVKVQKIINDTPTVKTLLFKDGLCSKSKPGQFVMLWIPRLDEIPMSLSYIGSPFSGISVRKVGEATEAIHELKKNSEIGLRGPYGNSFKILKGRILVIGGGCGMAPLNPLISELGKNKAKTTVIIGANTSSELLFYRQLKRRLNKNLITTTEDGSEGFKGLATDILPRLLQKKTYSHIYACGPELMLKKILEQTLKRRVPVQMSLERHMKCGVGICGSCMIDGLRICKEGPIISGKSLRKLGDFGFFRLDSSGSKTALSK